jgi:hypothetical protein
MPLGFGFIGVGNDSNAGPSQLIVSRKLFSTAPQDACLVFSSYPYVVVSAKKLLTSRNLSPYYQSITEKGGGPVEMKIGSKSDETMREVIDC